MKTLRQILFALFMTVAALALTSEKARAAMLDFNVSSIVVNPNGSRTLYVDIFDLAGIGSTWQTLALRIDGIPYPINGYNIVGSNGVLVRAWFYVPSYYGTHTLQLAATYYSCFYTYYAPFSYCGNVFYYSPARWYNF